MKAINTLHKMQLVKAKSKLLSKLDYTNLQGCDNLINEALPYLGAFYENVLKEWETGQHLITTINGETHSIYASLNPNCLDPRNDKFETHKKFNNTYVLSRSDSVAKAYRITSFNTKEYIEFISAGRDKFNIYSSKKNSLIKENVFKANMDKVRAISLVALAAKKFAANGGKASKGSIKSTKTWVNVGFVGVAGYRVEKKTFRDAHNIIKEHCGYSKSYKTLERLVHSAQGEIEFEAASGSYSIIISKGQNVPTPNNYIKVNSELDLGLNLKDDAVLLGVGTSPAEISPSKDNNKKTSAEDLLERVRAQLSEEQIMAAVMIFHNIYTNAQRKNGLDYLELNELDYTTWVIGALNGWFKQGLKKGFNMSQINYKLTKLTK